jgi:hypothetical protein
MKKYLVPSFAFVMLLLLGALFINGSNDNSSTYETLFRSHYKVYALNMPEKMDLAGEPVPLKDEDAYERLDRELLVNTYWQSNMLLLFKRANRYFPIIRPILKKNNIPDDFKYLPLIETGFQDMVSSAGAEGPWQFLSSTAKSYGLQIDDQVDERYHVEKATEAACKYLNDAYKSLGSWTMVAASYNCGVGALKNAISKQGVTNYYDLYLNDQTARYVFRLLAVKEIMEHPDKYGFEYKKKHLYQDIPVDEIKIDGAVPDLVAFAKDHGITYKVLKIFNPWLRSDKLLNMDHKTYYIDIPKDKAYQASASAGSTFEVPVTE